jgi:hypothetical protein
MISGSKSGCDIYIDESSEGENFDHTVIGGVIVDTHLVKEVTGELQSCKKHPTAELKWNLLDNRNFRVYCTLLEKFAKARKEDKVHFHCIVIANKNVDHAKYNAGNIDIGFNKFIYQLLIKFARVYSKQHFFYVYPDERRTPQTGNEFRQVLNNGANNHRDILCRPFRLVQFRKSKDSPLIQLADVLIGAICYDINGHALKPNAREGKMYFLKELKKLAQMNSFLSSTPLKQKTFTVWHFRLSI